MLLMYLHFRCRCWFFEYFTFPIVL